MNKRLRQRFEAMPLHKLRPLPDEILKLIKELEAGPRREIDIVTEHSEDPALVARILRTEGDPNGNDWYQIERIYCSPEKCPNCPHGDYRFRYQRNKRKKTIRKKFIAKMVFDHETIERMKKHIGAPIATYEIRPKKD